MVQRLARSMVVVGGLCLASSYIALPLWAAERKGQRTADAAPPATNYVAIDAAEVRRILPPAPVAGSLADKADLETVLRAQAARTPSDVALAERVAMTDFGVIWPGYSNDQFPVTAKLLGEVFTDLAMVLASAKDLYQRPRPPKSHPEVVKPCLIVPQSFSYPSGHSTVGFVFASVLGAIVPDKRADTLDRAHLFAWARVMGGVHYPCDIVGGRLLADAFITRLLENPDFQAKLQACRAELTSAPVGAHSGP